MKLEQVKVGQIVTWGTGSARAKVLKTLPFTSEVLISLTAPVFYEGIQMDLKGVEALFPANELRLLD